MRHKHLVTTFAVLFLAGDLFGQMPSPLPSAMQASSKAPSVHAPYYFESPLFPLDLILPLPPARESATTAAELGELHRIEVSRTPAQIARAQADDREEDIFIFRDVLGQDFAADRLPITAALSTHLRKDEGTEGSSLKNVYRRPRPYQVDSTLHPVCPVNQEPTSYPSGHSLSAYLLALTLVQMVPEKRQQIFDRADEYVHNRLICGVHYASDTEAGRKLAYTIFGSMAVSQRFRQDLAAAREETRRKLGLPLSSPAQ